MKRCGLFVFIFTFLTVICAFLLRPQYMNFSNKAFFNLTSSIKEIGDSFYAVMNKSELIYENESLKKRLSVVNSYEDENEILKKENENLHKLLRLKKESRYKNTITANVIRLNTLGEFTLTIDCGKNQGVDAGCVAVWGNALVGRVKESFDDFSYVVPITSPDTVVGILNENEDAGLITGKPELYQKNMCELSFFSNTAEAIAESTVITSGLSDVYPKWMIVGKITKENGMAVVKTEVDFFKIRTLSLITSG